MVRAAIVCAFGLVLTACASRIQVSVENQSREPIDLVIITPPSGTGATGYSHAGKVFHVELLPGEQWRSRAAKEVDRGTFAREFVVIERENHERSSPAPAGSRTTSFPASHEQGRVTLVFSRESDGWGYQATFHNGAAASVSPLDRSRLIRERDLRDLLERWE